MWIYLGKSQLDGCYVNLVMHKILTKFILTLLVYPIATLLTSIIVGILTGDLTRGVIEGIKIVAYSLTGAIPLIGPLVYLYIVIPYLKLTPWIIPAALGLVTAISYTTITTRLLIDMMRRLKQTYSR